ncbi:hypothetical protein RHMOL_Rhmol03G0298700 [Rhododendron molle]|uniref:Uncharacterized protein n=1 Tax=Rhododendron molle TaxID=49168 RepID=A0ACC0PLA1_RHOML|nr:hypothetical protein RHMOL_Rhmol03G0298700 [Rhododendron molle]
MSSILNDTPQEKLRLSFNLDMTNISALLFKIGKTFLTQGLAKLSGFAQLKSRSKSFYIYPSSNSTFSLWLSSAASISFPFEYNHHPQSTKFTIFWQGFSISISLSLHSTSRITTL